MPSVYTIEGAAGRRRPLGREPARPGELNYDPFDRYTFAHTAFGGAAALAGLPWWAVLGLALGYEFLEPLLEDKLPFLFPSSNPRETAVNAIADVTVAMLGWGAVRYVKSKL